MSLDYEYHGTEDTKKWTKKDKEDYHALVWVLFAVDIANLNAASVEAVVRRNNAMRVTEKPLTVEHCRKYFGLTTNATTLTGREWALKRMAEPSENKAWIKGIGL